MYNRTFFFLNRQQFNVLYQSILDNTGVSQVRTIGDTDTETLSRTGCTLRVKIIPELHQKRQTGEVSSKHAKELHILQTGAEGFNS